MKTPEQRIAQAQRDLEAQLEWQMFTAAIQVSRPAIETFTKKALMLLHLAMGAEALIDAVTLRDALAKVKEGK
jgi:hypothetical protein